MDTHRVCRARGTYLASQELLQLFSPLSQGLCSRGQAVDAIALTFIALPAVSSQSPLELGNSGYFFFSVKK